RFSSPPAALLAAVLFLLLPVTVHSAHMLMLRHYVEGLVLALASLLLWDQRNRSGWVPVVAAFAYLASMLAKEIYAPLPLLMLAHSVAERSSPRQIMTHMLAPAAAALIYLPWRFAMLSSAGGYGAFSLTENAVNLIPNLTTAVLGSIPAWSHAIWIVLVVLLVVPVVSRVADSRTLIILFLTLFFLVLPLIPIVSKFESRHAFAVSVVFAFFVGLAAGSQLPRPRVFVLATLIVLITGAAGRAENELVSLRDEIMIAEGQLVWNGEDHLALFGTSGVWYLDGLRYLRQEIRNEKAPSFYLSTVGLALDDVPTRKIVSAVNWPPPQVVAAQRRTLMEDDLPVELARDGRVLSWQVPDGGSEWYLLSPAGYELYRLPSPTGRVILPFELWAPSLELSRPMTFRFVRKSPDGISTVSPPISPEGVVRNGAGPDKSM
ncbi:MAG: hypothetical protein R3338_05930, partial [Thermoanaerobaculia bacterium]|nr:hypothetical protein [Thermoanaerobaculia bacterium]